MKTALGNERSAKIRCESSWSRRTCASGTRRRLARSRRARSSITANPELVTVNGLTRIEAKRDDSPTWPSQARRIGNEWLSEPTGSPVRGHHPAPFGELKRVFPVRDQREAAQHLFGRGCTDAASSRRGGHIEDRLFDGCHASLAEFSPPGLSFELTRCPCPEVNHASHCLQRPPSNRYRNDRNTQGARVEPQDTGGRNPHQCRPIQPMVRRCNGQARRLDLWHPIRVSEPLHRRHGVVSVGELKQLPTRCQASRLLIRTRIDRFEIARADHANRSAEDLERQLCDIGHSRADYRLRSVFWRGDVVFLASERRALPGGSIPCTIN